MLSNRQLTEIALSGRWIYAGCAWLDQNTPCAASLAIQEISKIMPFTIRRGDRVANRTQLAKHCLRAYCGKTVFSMASTINRRKESSSNLGIEPAMVAEIADNGPAMASDFKIKYAGTRLRNQFERGRLMRTAGVYYVEGQDPTTYLKRSRAIAVGSS